MTQVWIPVPSNNLANYEREIEEWLVEHVGSCYIDNADKGCWCHGPYMDTSNGDLVRVYYIRDDDKAMAVKLMWL